MANADYSIIKNGSGLDYLPDGAAKFNTLNSDSLKA